MSILRCFFLRMRLRRFLIRDPIADDTVPQRGVDAAPSRRSLVSCPGVRRRLCPPFPKGWYVVADADEVPGPDLVAFNAFGRDLVMGRDDDGAVRVTQDLCPHVGGLFSQGGGSSTAASCARSTGGRSVPTACASRSRGGPDPGTGEGEDVGGP